jgi:hypothetical protein
MIAAKQTPAYVFHANLFYALETFGVLTDAYTTLQRPQWSIRCKENKKKRTSKVFPNLFGKMS